MCVCLCSWDAFLQLLELIPDDWNQEVWNQILLQLCAKFLLIKSLTSLWVERAVSVPPYTLRLSDSVPAPHCWEEGESIAPSCAFFSTCCWPVVKIGNLTIRIAVSKQPNNFKKYILSCFEESQNPRPWLFSQKQQSKTVPLDLGRFTTATGHWAAYTASSVRPWNQFPWTSYCYICHSWGEKNYIVSPVYVVHK